MEGVRCDSLRRKNHIARSFGKKGGVSRIDLRAFRSEGLARLFLFNSFIPRERGMRLSGSQDGPR